MEERIYDIRVKEGEKPCDTDKHITKKDGTIAYMNHNGHWDFEALIGCKVKLSIGTYRYMAKEKINKKWNMTISNGLISITGDRQMLRSRKKMNNKYIVTKVKEAIDKIKNVVVDKINNLKNLLSKHQLCLPMPKDELDLIIQDLEQYKEVIECIGRFNDFICDEAENLIQLKSQYIFEAVDEIPHKIQKKYYRKAAKALHPDRNTNPHAIEMYQLFIEYL